jgi:hypothetical protein
LIGGLSDGFNNREAVKNAVDIFLSILAATRQADTNIFDELAEKIA